MRSSLNVAFIAALAGVSAQGVTSIISAPGTAPSGCALSQSGVFGIQIVTQTSSAAAALKKRQVTQISDGQIQATSAAVAKPVTQISDGQIQATSAVAAKPVTQISDGQIQATSAVAAVPVTQITDGQIQAPTSTAAQVVTVTVTKDNCVASPITQISDGQIQAPMATPVTQISDGQIQAPTTKAAATATPVTQIGDGQIQATSAKSGTAVAQITDGQIQKASTTLATSVKTSAAGMSTGTTAAGFAMLPGAAQACASSGTLEITLNNGILTDSKNRTGYIAANSQFQFDDPPQTGAIYTAGWSVCSNGTLALGGDVTFYQCLSGSFYNIYLDNVLGAAQCTPVQIEAIQLNSC